VRSLLVTLSLVSLGLLVLLGALVGCSGDEGPPKVTFAAAGSTVMASPTQYCDVNVKECQADGNAAVALKVPPGQAVEVSVPGSVSEAPWQVVFRYRAADGTKTQARSTVFPAGQRSEYKLDPPAADAQLETVEVQQFGAAMVARADGVDFATRATWVLSIDDRP
jgi:Protein of unknown function (DUF2771)